MLGWRSLYGSLLSSVTNPSVTLVHLSTINQHLENLSATYDVENPIIDLPVLFGAYQTIKSTAISQNLLSISNERLQDVPNRTQSPYTTNYVFGAAPAIGGDYDGNVTFALRSDLFVNNSSKILSSFSVDFGNGVGYQSMAVNTQKNITYSSNGTKTIKFKAVFTDGSIYYSHANFIVATIPSTGARYGDPNDNDLHRTYTFPRANATNENLKFVA